MSTIDLTAFVEENETAETLAYKHALDISYQIAEEMDKQGINQKQLSCKMGITPARLSTLLNTQPNMTLKSLAQFELALGVDFEIILKKQDAHELSVEGVLPRASDEYSLRADHLDTDCECYTPVEFAPASNKVLVLPFAA